MPTKLSKSSKPSKLKTAKTTAKKSGKKLSLADQNKRHNFLAIVVIVTAGLIAVSFGFSSYQKHSSGQVKEGLGSLYLRSTDSKGATVGSTINVSLYENSGSQPVNTVQSAVQYPSDKLELVEVKTGTAFPQEAATDSATPGLIRIARSVEVKSPAVTGAEAVATIQFKVLQDTDTKIALGIDQAASLLVRSTDNKNILNSVGTKTYHISK